MYGQFKAKGNEMDNTTDIALYKITARNTKPLYFKGTEDDCDRYVEWLNEDRYTNFYSCHELPQDQWGDFEDHDDLISSKEPGWDDFMQQEEEEQVEMDEMEEMDETAQAVQAAADEYGWGTRDFANELSSEGFESSDEILMAIGDLCEDAEDFVRIWEDPTEPEFLEVVRLAFSYTVDGEEELDWGQEVVTLYDLEAEIEVAPVSASKAALEEGAGGVRSLGLKADGPSLSH